MKNNKAFIISSLVLLAIIFGLLFIFSNRQAPVESNDDEKKGLKIVYTNDIHSYIYNTLTDSEGNSAPGLRLSNISALVKDLRNDFNDVILVDCGDEVQGAIFGSIDMGHSIIDLMNSAGYQAACPGNHDFDYGMDGFLDIVSAANFPYLCCNFRSTESGELVLPASAVIDTGTYKVALIGISTPTTIANATPAFFENENGDFIYSFDGFPKIEPLVESLQSEIDKVRDSVDYVIALSHVGIEDSEILNDRSALSVINRTSGLDVFIDGHSHTVCPCKYVKDKSGNNVLYTQSGSFLNNVGIVDFDGAIDAYLLDKYDSSDAYVAAKEDELMDIVQDQMGQIMAVLQSSLYITDPQSGLRLVRSRETNLGDFVPDSIYWYFNNMLDIKCDIALANAGGIRKDIPNGDVTYLDIKEVEPFGNQICLIWATGQEIIDCLEFGAKDINNVIDEDGGLSESGGFMQVAGISYTIDGNLESSAVADDNDMFVSIDGEYKVNDVKVYNHETCQYEDIVPDALYTVGGINYILQNGGNGMTMFMDNEAVIDFVGQDADILALYMKYFKIENNIPSISTVNSELSDYPGYLIDYENPYGSARIKVS